MTHPPEHIKHGDNNSNKNLLARLRSQLAGRPVCRKPRLHRRVQEYILSVSAGHACGKAIREGTVPAFAFSVPCVCMCAFERLTYTHTHTHKTASRSWVREDEGRNIDVAEHSRHHVDDYGGQMTRGRGKAMADLQADPKNTLAHTHTDKYAQLARTYISRMWPA